MGLMRNPEFRPFFCGFLLLTLCSIAGSFFFGLPAVCFVAAGWVLCWIALLSFLHRRYRAIASLSDELNRTLHGDYSLPISDYSEGELSVLRSEIYKMTVMLREQAEILKKDKVYLAEAMSDISHQLKTPLTSMNLLVSRLQQEAHDSQREALRELHRLLGRMEWMVSTLLKMSKLDAGTVFFQQEDIAVEKLIQAAAQPLSIPMELREQTLAVDCPDVKLTGDFPWTVEAVGNILKNCMEHTPMGGEIRVSGEETALYTGITIEDTGPGIDKDDLPHLFERFYVGKHASKDSIGIGLALAKSIIVQQNGTIQARNLPQGGACFSIRFYKKIV